MMRHGWIVLLLLLAPLVCAATGSAGAPHVFLDRTHVSLGDTVTLNIQSSGTLDTPDLSPLQNDFQVLGTSRSRSVQITNGKAEATSQQHKKTAVTADSNGVSVEQTKQHSEQKKTE